MEYTPEAQCQGHYEFDYALVPHSGSWEAEEALVLREAQAFNIAVPARAVVTELHAGQLPSQAALLSVAPAELVVSAIKRSNREEGLVVRVYNPLAHEVEARIRPGFPFTRAYLANLLEERMINVETIGEQTVQVNIRGGGITTLLFT